MKYNFTSGAELLEKCKELNMTIHELCRKRSRTYRNIKRRSKR